MTVPLMPVTRLLVAPTQKLRTNVMMEMPARRMYAHQVRAAAIQLSSVMTGMLAQRIVALQVLDANLSMVRIPVMMGMHARWMDVIPILGARLQMIPRRVMMEVSARQTVVTRRLVVYLPAQLLLVMTVMHARKMPVTHLVVVSIRT